MKVLVINAGSSSLKYQLMDPETREVLAKGLCERIGIDGRLTHKIPARDAKHEFEIPMPTHAEAIQAVLDALLSPEYGVIKSASEIDAVGHRVVHGGEKFAASALITGEVMAAIEECIPLAPLHNPANITGIKACQAVMPGVPMVAVFDTAFHQTMPAKSYIYALPYEYYEKDKVRRYGFHGTSHKYVSGRAAAMLGKPIEQLKIITCHLGNGSSVTAVDGGKSVDTSMGFTPLAGLPMGTRSGDLDAGILEYLMNRYGYDIKEMLNILNKKSGVLGISGVSSDFRDLSDAAEQGNQRAELAVDAFNYGVKKLIGAYAAAMGGVDAIVFTAGVGENSADQRLAIASGLEFMGVKMDAQANNVRG
ncbi:acetate kinase, partial [Lawsonibacter hominis]